VLEPGELVVRVSVPRKEGRTSAFEKLRRRGAIDFPLLSIVARMDLSPEGTRLEAADVVVSALGARPRRVRVASRVRPGTSIDGLAYELGQPSIAECKPLPNVDDDTDWRREMVAVLVERAAARALGR
jgi:4-hydroxybenzoyl-CoA reductase subunit beta